jgi:NAD(P)H-hydrate repair Nnr-like enzyme with NAD(P)H-hydrate dehydratase domain
VISDIHRASWRRNADNDNGNGPHLAVRPPTEHEEGNTMKKFGLATAVAIGLGTLSTFVAAGTAAADGLDVSPPAIIDADGLQNYDTSSYPETPSYPAVSSWPG